MPTETTTKPKFLHHAADSQQFEFAKYNAENQKLYVGYKPGTVYVYHDVPQHIFDNLLTAKDSTAEPTETTRGPIGKEKPGSEGSYLIHHIKGLDWKNNAPFKYRKLDSVEIEDLEKC